MKSRILIVGAGDLGSRIAGGLIHDTGVGLIVLAGRDSSRGTAFAALLNDCGEADVAFEPLDALRRSDTEKLLRCTRPDLIVQAAILLSPWYLAQRQEPAVRALLSAGFAAQLPAQSPIVRAVMEAVRATDFRGPVINCSFPDVTNPILKCLELEPTIGVGNAAMIARRVAARLRGGQEVSPLVRVLAHHSQVTATIRSEPPRYGRSRPLVFLGEKGARADQLAYEGVPLNSDPSLNALSAASALPVIRALLPGARPARLSVPGPLGMPGGYPVKIESGQIELDLPPGLSANEAVLFQQRCAQEDGIDCIDRDGTVHFTEQLRAALSQIDPALAEPLSPSDAYTRFLLFRDRLYA
ncbi:MAG TPA: hypothetical protein VKV15_06595 [Bryobacteraceae bacterium]|nr:hypothetical protein [Bryobacteraceae bacterium]